MSDALALLASLVIEDGRRWGDAATAWQWRDATAVLDPGDGARQHFLTRPRGGSKTSDLAGMAIAALVHQLPPASRSYWIAADRDQGRLGVDAMAGLIARSGLGSMLKADQWRVTAASGATLDVLAADGPGTMGLRGHLYVVDELAAWPSGANHRRVWTGLISAVPKVPGCRLVVLTNAGDPVSLAGAVRDRALLSDLWRVHEVPGPLPWISERQLEDQRAQLTDSEFARLHENRWVQGQDRLVTMEDLRAAVMLEGPQPYVPGNRYWIGLDIGLTNDRSVVAVCHAETDDRSGRQRVVLDFIRRWQGSRRQPVDLEDVERTVAGLSSSYGRSGKVPVRADPFEAHMMIQRLRSKGVPVQPWQFSPVRYAEIARNLIVLLRDHRMWLPNDPTLLDELATVHLRESGTSGQIRVDHEPGKHDDQVVAVGMATVACLEGGWVRRVLTPLEREERRRAERMLGASLTAGVRTRAF